MLWIYGLVLIIGCFAVGAMLHAITGRGGEKNGDAGETGTQVVAQAAAFRVDRSHDAPAWDGVERLKGIQGNDGPA